MARPATPALRLAVVTVVAATTGLALSQVPASATPQPQISTASPRVSHSVPVQAGAGRAAVRGLRIVVTACLQVWPYGLR